MPSNSPEYAKQYYSKNKERLQMRNKTMSYCSLCEKEVTQCNMRRHKQSERHQSKLLQKENKDMKRDLDAAVKRVLSEYFKHS